MLGQDTTTLLPMLMDPNLGVRESGLLMPWHYLTTPLPHSDPFQATSGEQLHTIFRADGEDPRATAANKAAQT